MKQQTLTGFERYGKTTRRAQFLADMHLIVPWAELAAVVELAGVNYFFRRRQLFLPVLSLHHWSTIAQSDAKSVRSSGSEISARFRS